MMILKKKTLIVLLLLLALVLYLMAAFLPYARHQTPEKNALSSFTADSFYHDTAGTERAMIISDNGTALEERIRLISQANERIILSTFDFKEDNSGKLMLAALAEAAERGVEVCILTDGFSYFAHMMGKPYFHAVASLENVTFKVYNPVNLLLPHQLMARMHDKYLIADQSAYILGGRNTYDFFLGDETDYINYDWDVLVCSESPDSFDSLMQLNSYFSSVWEHPTSKVKMDHVSVFSEKKVKKARTELKRIYQEQQRLHPEWFECTDMTKKTVPVNRITLLTNPIQPSVKKPVLFYQMTELMKKASGDIYFHTPYIICSNDMINRLEEVCESGKTVTMMTNSVANNGNPFGAVDYKIRKPAILDTGVQILEYDSGVSYHGKCFTIGDRLCGIGSFNWDMRSAYIDTEIMLVIDSKALTEVMRKEMKHYEDEALIVHTADSYQLNSKQTPQPLTGKRALRTKLLRPFNALLRFLM